MSNRDHSTRPLSASVEDCVKLLDFTVTQSKKGRRYCREAMERAESHLQSRRNFLDSPSKVTPLRGAVRRMSLAERPVRTEAMLAETTGALALLEARCARCGQCPSRAGLRRTPGDK